MTAVARRSTACFVVCVCCRWVSIEEPQRHGRHRWRCRASFACGTRSNVESEIAPFPRPFDVEMHGQKRDTPVDRALHHSHCMLCGIFGNWRDVSLIIESCPVVHANVGAAE
jgi:hypothetical protein